MHLSKYILPSNRISLSIFVISKMRGEEKCWLFFPVKIRSQLYFQTQEVKAFRSANENFVYIQ